MFRAGRSFLCHMIDCLHVVHRPPLSRSPTTPLPSCTSLPRIHLFYGCFGVLGLCSLARRHMVPGEMGLSLPVVIHHREGNDQLSWSAKCGDLLGVVFRWFATQITSQSLQMGSRTSKHKGMMHLLHSLVFVEVHLQCYLYPTYIDTKASHLADSLSHNNVRLFLSKVLSDRQCTSCRSLNSAAGPATGSAG